MKKILYNWKEIQTNNYTGSMLLCLWFIKQQQKICRNMEDLNNTMNQPNLIAIYRNSLLGQQIIHLSQMHQGISPWETPFGAGKKSQ